MSSDETRPQETMVDEEEAGRAAALPGEPTTGHSSVGRRVGNQFVIEGLLGNGPLGPAYAARRDTDGQRVLLKMLHSALRENPSVQRRLARQFESGSRLSHLHIAQAFEHGIDPEQGAFLARELIDGEDLISALKRGAMTPRRVCVLLVQLLSALSEAHRHGVLHGNLKPENVRVTRDASGQECVKVCDFGSPLRTPLGALYMAPEQHDAPSIDGRVDVYAVGVMLYQLLTDEVPFRGATVEEIRTQQLGGAVVPPHQLHPDRPLPTELEAVCLKALSSDPKERHRSPREMSQALRAVVALLDGRADEPLGSRAFGPSDAQADAAQGDRITMPGEQLRSRTKFWLGAGLLAAVCVGVLMSPEAPPPDESPRHLAPLPQNAARMTESGSPLESGMKRLREGDVEGAVTELRAARRVIGDSPELLRALGEALILQGKSSAEGTALLSRYLQLEPNARDRRFVESLVRRGELQQQELP